MYLLAGLYDMADEFENETGAKLEPVFNEGYTERIEELRESVESLDHYPPPTGQ